MDTVKENLQRLGKMRSFSMSTWKEFTKAGKEDPKRVVHSVKVGLALALVSLLYLLRPVFQDLGKNITWAIMTVVVVFENTTGATLFKGFNRIIGTVGASLCAFLAEYIADTFGYVFRIIFVVVAVFITGVVSSYVRFFPYIKKNYDYAVSIWLLTFCLVIVSSHRAESAVKVSKERCVAIAIGCGVCLVTTLIFPIWSGEQLHSSTTSRLEKLSNLVQACVCDYFKDEEESNGSTPSTSANDYLDFVDAKSQYETWALHSSWEPRYLRHFRYSWKEYVTLGSSILHLGTTLVILHGISQCRIQAPKSIRDVFRDPCTKLATEVSKALVELATSIKNRQHWSEDEVLSPDLRRAQEEVKTALDSLLVNNPPEAARVAGFLCVLEQVVEKLEEVVDQAGSLATIARFKECWYDVDELKEVTVDEQPETSNGGDGDGIQK